MGKAKSSSFQKNASFESVPKGSKQRRTRSRIACDSCHSQHARCDRVFPCSRCLRRNNKCVFSRRLRKRGRIPKQHGQSGNDTCERMGSTYDTFTPPSEAQVTLSPEATTVEAPGFPQPGPNPANSVTLSSSPSIDDPPPLDGMLWPIQGLGTKMDAMEWSFDQYMSPGCVDILAEADLNEDILSLEPVHIADPPRVHGSPKVAGSEVAAPTPGQIISNLRYPVLQPLIPFIESDVSKELACGLLELYFTSAFPGHMHPVCHHIHCYVLRKSSFLNKSSPRPSSLGLLASMLWVAALDDSALSLPISPHYRKKVCNFLGSLTMELLKPLAQTPPDTPLRKSYSRTSSFTLDPAPSPEFAPYPSFMSNDPDVGCQAGALDDVLTYIHIASIISASEQKALGMRWWYAAFTLARELKLNREIEITLSTGSHKDCTTPRDSSLDYSVPNRCVLNCMCLQRPESPVQITEEKREERRRVWWLLYIMDRHLALCSNRPLVLLDSESTGLLLPLDEEAWQAGEIHSSCSNSSGPQCLLSGYKNMRRTFPDLTCHDHSLFGFFLPLMTLVGQAVDLNRVKNHPVLGAGALGKEALDSHRREVLRRLDEYEASLRGFTKKGIDPGSPSSPETGQPTTCASPAQTYWISQTIASYASYYVHVSHILLDGKWDPVSLMEDRDFWTSPPDFSSTIPHALNTANSVEQIMKFDPDISFMPDLFRIQLLQRSLHFLLIVERLQSDAGESVLNACDIIIRATGVCIVTLNSEYRRTLPRVMRSAVAQARGRPINQCEIQWRRRAILALYGWTGTLAL
ncbi:Zn(II)2Cys6 transcription factor [Aspergillus lucknowensis]|uniref:Fungal-specific transcription factor domain-containing protein n=1 Tax=Aspergillus lucknowensis TaxID=176173 RepID=A0ABR4LF62_9EURO